MVEPMTSADKQQMIRELLEAAQLPRSDPLALDEFTARDIAEQIKNDLGHPPSRHQLYSTIRKLRDQGLIEEVGSRIQDGSLVKVWRKLVLDN